MNRQIRYFTLIILSFFHASLPAWGAKYPSSVPKTFSVQGPTALEWANLLGFKPEQPQTLQLWLHPMEVEGARRRTGDSSTSSVPTTQISFDPKNQTLTLSGHWLDETTGSNKNAPHFTFSSGFISEDLSNAGAWADLLKAWGFPQKREASAKYGDLLEKRTSSHGFPKLQIRVYRMQSWEKDPNGAWGYQAVIGIDPD